MNVTGYPYFLSMPRSACQSSGGGKIGFLLNMVPQISTRQRLPNTLKVCRRQPSKSSSQDICRFFEKESTLISQARFPATRSDNFTGSNVLRGPIIGCL